MGKYRKYDKKDEHSYAFGTYPTIDALKNCPSRIHLVLLKKDGKGSDGFEEILDLCYEKGVRFEYADRAIDRIAFKENTYAIAIFDKYERNISDETDHVLLHNPKNMGNIGTIIRTMLAFDLRDLAIIKPAADIFDPKVVRSAMGALFSINFQYFDNFEEYRNKFNNHQLYTLALEGSENITDIKFTNSKSVTVVFGNEGAGLPDDIVKGSTSIKIPQSELVDSLNLSVAAGITFWELYKQRKG